MEVKSKKLPKSQIELEFELTAEEFAKHTQHALEHLKHHVKIDGFREGKAPAKMIEDKIKPEALLMEAGDHAVQHVYTDYIQKNNLEVVGHPEVQIVKILDPRSSKSEVGAKETSHSAKAPRDAAFIFKAVVTVLPEVELPDYKEIGKKIKGKDISVAEEEIQDAINYLQKTRAKFTPKNPSDSTGQALKGDFVEIKYNNKDINEGKDVDDKFILGEGGFMQGFEDNIIGMKAGEEKDFSIEKFVAPFKVKVVSVQKMELPEINDEFAKELGAFDTLTALKENMKEGIIMEKKEAEKQRIRAEILDKIAEKAKLEMPEAMVEYEQENLMEDLKNKVSQMFKNTSFSAQSGPASGWEQYLASIKKTEAEIKETYKKEAEKRLRGFLVLREIGKQENVEVSEKEVEEEMSKIMKQKPFGTQGVPPQGKFDINQLKEYTKGVIHNEKIFKKLEECQ